MSTLVSHGARLHYEVAGAADSPPLVLSPSIGTNLSLWEPQLTAFAERFRVIRYDTRGHGASDAPPGEYSLQELGEDLLALLDELGIASAHVCGLSLGGLAAQWLAIHCPERVRCCVLANTAARIGTVDSWTARIDLVRSGGMAAVHDLALERFLSAGFRARHPDVTQAVGAMLDATSAAGYIGCCAALRDADLRTAVCAVRAPTLVIAGALDLSTPPADSASLAAWIPHAELLVIDDAAHLSNLEQPVLFTQTVLSFLTRT